MRSIVRNDAKQIRDPRSSDADGPRISSAPHLTMLRIAREALRCIRGTRAQYLNTRDPISAPTAVTSAVASVYQVATNSGESSVQCEA
jgi:hypothetical protein